MACSFSGDGAEQQAETLVLELRKRYKLPAYTHRVRFDFSDAGERGIDRYGAPIRMRYRGGTELKEIAVLVGDYPAVDNPNAQKTLYRLKYTHPKCLGIGGERGTNQSLAGWRMMQKQAQDWLSGRKKKKKRKGPMGHAFITTNPALPKEYYVPKGIDSLELEMNKNVKYSLLDCPGKYTVQVAKFTGKVILNQGEIREIQNGGKMESGLARAALKAHRLTKALRILGYEAYEFHDRRTSIVTVGSFNSVGTPRGDGKIEINPRIHKLMKKMVKHKAVIGIPLDIHPIPILVPKRSIAADYNRQVGRLW